MALDSQGIRLPRIFCHKFSSELLGKFSIFTGFGSWKDIQ